jgi:predicted dehydrogenase
MAAKSQHEALIFDFLDCLATGRTPQTICTDNIKSLAMVEAAVESAKSEKKVKVQW